MTQLSRSKLPPYVVINDPFCENKEVLKTSSETVGFPLNKDARDVISYLEAKFEQEDNCAGLAAPQIGYNKRILILALEEDEELKKDRPDFSDTLPKSIWINPSFTPLSLDKTTDWEACFSVDNLVGRVARFTEITYDAWTPEGEKVHGRAKGLLARLIQHEIDHLDGVLFIDYVPEGELITREEYYRRMDEE
ncbi:MAG TPA: peptide deformylase [Alphaproteobacteria bacterium]|nr:peptide deformylase [Alphaproteobacteria bacterium]